MKKQAVFLFSIVLVLSFLAGVYAQEESETSEKQGNFFAKIANFFKNLFSNNSDSESSFDKSDDLISGTDDTQTEQAAETLSFFWEKDSGSRVADGSVPFVHKLNDERVRLYYCNTKGILSAVSKDGLTFAKEQGVRVSPGIGFELQVCDP